MASYEAEFSRAWGSFNSIPEWTWRPIKPLRERFYQEVYHSRNGYDSFAVVNAWKEEWPAQRKRFTLFRLSDLPTGSTIYRDGEWYDVTDEFNGIDIPLSPLRLEITGEDNDIVVVGMFSVWRDGEHTHKLKEENIQNCIDSITRDRVRRAEQQAWELRQQAKGIHASQIVEWRWYEDINRKRGV